MMNSFNPYMGMNMNIPQINPYQQKMERYDNLQQQKSNTNMNFVVVENMQKAKEQIVPYGYTMWMRDSNEPYQYIKSVDQVGTPTFRVLKVEDITEDINNNSQDVRSYENFVSIEDYNTLMNRVDNLQENINYCNDLIKQAVKSASENGNQDIVIDAQVKEVKKRGLLNKGGDA